MSRNRQPLPEDIQELLSTVRRGRLFALQDWIKAGKRVCARDRNDVRAQVLRIAVETGFHSIVEELLRAHSWERCEFAEALEWAFHTRRSDLAELLLNHGAKIADLDFETVCRTMDQGLMERFLREGGDPSRGNAFARALTDMKARPLLRFYRTFRSEFPCLDDQAALALHEAVDRQQVRWTALLAWAGADPFRPVPWSSEDAFPVDPESHTNAAEQAVWRKNPDILKVLKLKPKPADALQLLWDAAHASNLDLFRQLLQPLSREQLNDSPQDSCTVLERLVARSPDRNIWTRAVSTKGDEENLQCIELLLDAGARWNPKPEDFRYPRRHMVGHEGKYLVRLLRLLLYTPDAAEMGLLLDFCNSSTLRAKIAAADPPLLQELKQLRKGRK